MSHVCCNKNNKKWWRESFVICDINALHHLATICKPGGEIMFLLLRTFCYTEI